MFLYSCCCSSLLSLPKHTVGEHQGKYLPGVFQSCAAAQNKKNQNYPGSTTKSNHLTFGLTFNEVWLKSVKDMLRYQQTNTTETKPRKIGKGANNFCFAFSSLYREQTFKKTTNLCTVKQKKAFSWRCLHQTTQFFVFSLDAESIIKVFAFEYTFWFCHLRGIIRQQTYRKSISNQLLCFYANHKFKFRPTLCLFSQWALSYCVRVVHFFGHSTYFTWAQNLFSICVRSTSHGRFIPHIREYKEWFLLLPLSHSCRFPSSQSRYSAALCRCGPSPNYNKDQEGPEISFWQTFICNC